MTFPYDAAAQLDISHEPLVEFLFFVAVCGIGAVVCLVGIAIAKAISLSKIRRDARTIERELRKYL